MVTKDRKKRQKKKQWSAKNNEGKKTKAHIWYEQNRESAIEQSRSRMLTDQTMRRDNILRVKARLLNNDQYKETNKLRAVNCDRMKRNNPESREQELAKLRDRMKTKLNTDKNYQKQHRARLKRNKKLRLQNDKNREEHRASLRRCAKLRLENDQNREEHRAKMKQYRKLRLQQDDKYREEHRSRMKALYHANPSYRDANRQKAKQRYRHLHSSDGYKQLTDRQKYWLRRRRLLAMSRRRAQLLQMRKKMESESGESMFNIQLLFNKAEHQIKVATAKAKQLHSKLSQKAQECLKYIPTDKNPIEADFVTAFEGERIHTTATEPYFWEQSSKPIPLPTPIPIDSTGRAHIYKVLTTGQDPETDVKTESSKGCRWECSDQVCCITKEQMTGSANLLSTMASIQPENVIQFYTNIDQCQYETRSDSWGHSVHCRPHCGCNSLLRPARALSCHFPYLRSMIRRIYDLRRLSLHIQGVNKAMSSGDYSMLQAIIQQLQDVLEQLGTLNTSTNNEDVDPQRPDVNEEMIMNQYGKSLEQVADNRDTYNSDSCDVCEQLRKDLRSLKSCEKLKGFQSEKMQHIIDLLYQNKTQHEDLDEFLESMKICSYCVDKLRSNKDVLRSIFNRLTVHTTPDCITKLNLIERTLIKFCMTCITVVRLGQVMNKARPHNELTAALKGRIAYLPVSVEANAQFVPENLLNVDRLVLLVGGQPTQNNKIWTSVVDLSKVHEALTWLRQHNHLYNDVPAYTIEDLQQIMHERTHAKEDKNKNAGDENNSALLKKLDEASKSYLYENFSIQPLNTSVPADAVIDYQLNKVSGQSMDIFESDLDVKAFPELFPTGENGIRDTKREMKISTSDFIKSKLLNKNPKFRLNINYLFHCFQVQEVSNMCHSIGHMMRSVTGNKLSAKQFHERLKQKDGEVNSNMFSLMANMRGSKEYFAKLGMDVKWMMKSLGPPTLFVTCSCAEWFSESFITYLRNISSTVPRIEEMTPAELCAMDPVNVSIHFHKKWDAIFSKLINSKNQPIFGVVQDYVYRIEYQARGAPHVHAILWIKDAPILGKNTPSEVEAYINSIITCCKPDQSSSPTLHSLVSQFQTHKCNKYCQKSYKTGTKFFKKCRFGFPRPIKSNFTLNDVIDCLAINKRKQPRKRLYHLPRTKTETHINDYNAALLLANEGNVDVQYIGHLGSRLPYYITDYMTKNERSEQDTMWKDIFTSTKSLGSNAMSFILQSVKSRQVGANEAADRLLGHKLYSKSRQLRFADLQPADKAKRVLKNVDDIGKLLKDNPDSSDIFHPHWVLDVYPDRPDELESSSLYEIISWYEKDKLMPNSSQPLQLKHLPYCLRRRKTTPYIVTHQVVNPHQSEENKETYYYYLLKLFKPWRNEQLLQIPGSNFYETYTLESDNLPEMVQYHEKNTELSKQDEDTENAIKERARQLNTTDELEHDDEQGAFAGCVTDHIQTAMEELITAHSAATKHKADSDLQQDYNTLNNDQRRIVDKVLTAVCHETHPIRLIVSGQGGTGKSKVIHVLHQLVSNELSYCGLSVVVAAPTGLAAYNIGGTTIHRLLCLPVEHGKPADYSRLNQDQLKTIRATLKNLQLLIIDEVSMVSSLTLLFIHMRLTEIMCCDDYFGGISVVFFADFLQLPPVKGNQPFVPVTFLEAKQRLGSIASIDLWNIFTYEELTINMRQSSDQKYADVLSDIRIGKVTDSGYKLLAERLITPGRRATVAEICQRYSDLVESNNCPLILLPRTSLCDEVNSAMLQRIGNEVYNLTATDTLDTVVNKKLMSKIEKAYKKTEEDTTRTAGLEKVVRMCVGARVMLKKNKDVDAGLVNGSVGTVVGFGISTKKTTVDIHSVDIQFTNMDAPVTIYRESCSFEVLKGIFYTRKQFPLMLAFAITIHKSQGLSLQSVIVDAGETTFGCGMVYVALSRVTTLQGLHLIDLNRQKIQCDNKAIKEYNRLRKLYKPHLGIIPHENKASEQTQANLPTERRRKRKNDDIIDTTDNNKRARENAPTPTTSDNKDISLTGYNECSIYDHCQIPSIDVDFQLLTCERLNLRHFEPRSTVCTAHQAENGVATLLQKAIYRQTGTKAHVIKYSIVGDGNCLFRALSQAVTGNQDQHLLFRSSIVNHMLDNSAKNAMEQVFNHGTHHNKNYLINMAKPGIWGTDQEIAAAAHLFDCSIVCFSKYSNRQFCLQHFPPHFISSAQCTSTCNHKTIYLINSSGTHYESAAVTITETQDEE